MNTYFLDKKIDNFYLIGTEVTNEIMNFSYIRKIFVSIEYHFFHPLLFCRRQKSKEMLRNDEKRDFG